MRIKRDPNSMGLVGIDFGGRWVIRFEEAKKIGQVRCKVHSFKRVFNIPPNTNNNSYLHSSIVLIANNNNNVCVVFLTLSSSAMDSDYGIPRELSDLQKLRSLYQPELPPCLQVSARSFTTFLCDQISCFFFLIFYYLGDELV